MATPPTNPALANTANVERDYRFFLVGGSTKNELKSNYRRQMIDGKGHTAGLMRQVVATTARSGRLSCTRAFRRAFSALKNYQQSAQLPTCASAAWRRPANSVGLMLAFIMTLRTWRQPAASAILPPMCCGQK